MHAFSHTDFKVGPTNSRKMMKEVCSDSKFGWFLISHFHPNMDEM